MKSTPTTVMAVAACLILVNVIAVTVTDLSAGETAAPTAQPAPKLSDAKYSAQGNLGLPLKCSNWTSPNPETDDQAIKIIVSPGPDAEVKTKYAVNISPDCVELSHYGDLIITLQRLVKNWNPKYLVDVEFLTATDMTPALAGPFVQVWGKPEKRGQYRTKFPRVDTKLVMKAKTVDTTIFAGWVGAYTVKIWDPVTGELLGEVDPGVKVIDDPGGLVKDKP